MSVREQRFFIRFHSREGRTMNDVLVIVFAILCFMVFGLMKNVIRLLYKVVDLCNHVISCIGRWRRE
jgi:hypothetical protein